MRSRLESIAPRRVVALLALLVGLLAVVAAASRARPEGGSAPPLPADFPSLFDLFLGLAALVALTVFGLLAYALWPRGRRKAWEEPAEEREDERLPWPARLLLACVPLLMLVAAIAVLTRFAHEHEAPPITIVGEPPSTAERAGDSAPVVGWWPFLVVGAIGAIALIAIAVVLVRDRRGRESAELRARKVVAAALDESLDDLERERDARRAVIAAYARMERALDSCGLPRRPADAPLEYLGRALTALNVDANALRRLTALFERAKFSAHAVDLEMKGEAIACLVTLRESLR
jgi:hypothetical protein